MAADGSADAIVARFVKFLSFRTVSAEGPNGAYAEAVRFLQDECNALGLQTTVHEFVTGKPILVALWRGRDDSLGRVLLNSHYDVVPAVPSKWKSTAPFTPIIRDGRVYGRGSQDMKCVCMQYIEAIAAIQRKNGTRTSPFTRTIALSFLPDEEIGGVDGAGRFVASPHFADLRTSVALDEGLACEHNAYKVYYGERAPWWLTVHATGAAGHGSRFVPGTAVERLVRFVNAALKFRAEQEARLGGVRDAHNHSHDHDHSHEEVKIEDAPVELSTTGCPLALGDVVTVNVTMLRAGVAGPASFGGYALNVIPDEAFAGLDIRIPPSVSMEEMERIIEAWRNGDDQISVAYNVRTPEHHVTSVKEEDSTPWWPVFRDAVTKDSDVKLEPEVFPAATDGRFFRKAGIPVFGFSPINNTPVLLHDHDEFLPIDVYLKGITVFERVVEALANHQEK